jgi:hypothetical protein
VLEITEEGGKVPTTYTVEALASGTEYTFALRVVKAGVVSEWTTGASAVVQQTTGAATTTDASKKSKPSGVKAGNSKNGANKPTVNTVELSLPDAVNTYVVTIDVSKIKFPKNFTWKGVAYTNTPTDKENFVAALNLEIRIEGNKAIISGLPAGMKFTFNVQKLSLAMSGDTTLSAAATVSVKTAKYAATKLKAVNQKGTAFVTTMNSAVLQPRPPKGDVDAGLEVTYQLVVSYVAKVNKVKTTFYCTLTIDADGNLLFADQGLKGDKAAKNGGFKTATDGFAAIGSLDSERATPTIKGAAVDCIRITGLPFAGTKYSFALTTVATDANGTVWTSAVGKTSIKTVKYQSPKLAKREKALAGDNSFTVVPSTAKDKPAGVPTYEVGVYDNASKTYLFDGDIKVAGFEIISTDGGVIEYKGAVKGMVLGVFEIAGGIQSDVLKVKVK